jgi:glycosyltransferase involved in cell wall biosynthesis
MRVGLIGGIYGKDEAFRKGLQVTPETILELGLRAQGHQVKTLSHYETIHAEDLDVVHVHHLSYGAIRMATDRHNVPFVYTSHDPLAMSGLLSLSRTQAARLVFSRADAVVALSESEARFQRRDYPLRGAVHAVIPNGILTEQYRYGRKNSAGEGRPWQLLFVGQLSEQKRVDVLLRALASLGERVELSLVYHTRVLESSLKELAGKLRLTDRVRFLGSRPPQELNDLYQASDLFVLPSAGEALPSVITEAMVCGTPVVATDVGGIREQLGEFGMVVAPGSVEKLAAAIQHVLDKYAEFGSRGEAMSRYARESFSPEAMVRRHLDLYEALIDQGTPRRRQSISRVPLNVMLRMGVNLLCPTK